MTWRAGDKAGCVVDEDQWLKYGEGPKPVRGHVYNVLKAASFPDTGGQDSWFIQIAELKSNDYYGLWSATGFRKVVDDKPETTAFECPDLDYLFCKEKV